MGFRVWGLGFRVQGSGFRAEFVTWVLSRGLGLRLRAFFFWAGGGGVGFRRLWCGVLGLFRV